MDAEKTHTSYNIFAKHQAAVDALVLDEKRNRLISCGRDGKIVAWNLKDEAFETIFKFEGPKAKEVFHRLAIKENLLAAGSAAGLVVIWDLENGNKKIVNEMEYAVADLDFGPEGELAIAGDSWRVRILKNDFSELWEAATYKFPYSACFSDDGKLLVGSWNGELYEADLKNLPEMVQDEDEDYPSARMPDLNVPQTASPIFKSIYLPGEKIAMAGHIGYKGEYGVMHIWEKGNKEFEYEFTCEDGIHALALSSDKKYLAAGGNDQTLWLWETENMKLIKKFQVHGKAIEIEKMSADDEFAQRIKRAGAEVKGFDHVTAHSWQNDSYYPLALEYYHASGEYAIHCIAFHPNQKIVYAGTQCGQILQFSY